MVDGMSNAEASKEEEKKKKKKGTGNDEEAAGGDQVADGKPTKKDGGEGKAMKAVVVLRLELHCHGCARKVHKAIKAAQGVEGVAMDMAASTVTVSGKADPWELKERIESRAHKPVAFLSPPDPPNNSNSNKKKKKKEEEEEESTVVVVKIRLHCDGCIDRIKRTARKIKGVEQVTVDTEKEQVTVKGTMDAKRLPDVLRHKLNREVSVVVVPPPAAAANKDGDEEEKAEQQQGGGGGKNKKNKKTRQQQLGGEDAGAGVGSISATEQQEEATLYGGGPYRVEMLQAPQLFSDENPNACALM